MLQSATLKQNSLFQAKHKEKSNPLPQQDETITVISISLTHLAIHTNEVISLSLFSHFVNHTIVSLSLPITWKINK